MPMTIRMPRKGAAALRNLTAQTAISATATFAVALAGQVLFQKPAPVAEPATPALSDGGKLSEPLHGAAMEDGVVAVRTSGPADLVQAFRLPIDLSGGQLVWAADLRESGVPPGGKPVVASLAAARPVMSVRHREAPHATVAVLPPSRPVILAQAATHEEPQSAARAGFLGMHLPKIPFGDKVVQAVNGLGGSLSQMIGRS